METAKGTTREDAINRLADRIDSFEKYTQPHSRLMAELAVHIARRFGLRNPDVDAINEAAMLHDIGLYTMSPPYHASVRPLSFEARLDLWRHPVIGEQQMAKRDAMRHAQLLVRWHHEWWNGSGYPDMLAFEDIPVGARILRAVELYSALLCDRPYRAALDDQSALEALTAAAGVECDPYVVKCLLALLDELRAAIQERAEKAQDIEVETTPVPPPEQSTPFESAPVPPNPEPSRNLWSAHQVPTREPVASDSVHPPRPWGDGLQAFVPTNPETAEERAVPLATVAPLPDQTSLPSQPVIRPAPPPLAAALLAQATSAETTEKDSQRWPGWKGSGSNKKALLGFQASVLRQLEFRSIAIPFWSEARLDWYLKAWGKVIFANDPSGWASVVARANVEATQPLVENTIARILEDVYVPGVRLANTDLRRWFGETDAWWMDNLRRNIETLDDPVVRAQALTLGLQTGDYALSFDEATRDLRRPLTTVFWRLAGRAFAGPVGQPHNRSFNHPAEEFIKHARTDLLYLRARSSHADHSGGAEARAEWREAWVRGVAGDERVSPHKTAAPPQSKHSYLASLDRLLRSASNFKTWAIEYQEPGLAAATDVMELIKEYRSVKATYSKDVTEVAGGLRSYIIIGEASAH